MASPDSTKKSHSFVKWHFSSPRWCDTCGEFIWGLGKQGYKCSVCKYSAHSKCKDAADSCGQIKVKNAEKGKGLSLGATAGGPPYVNTLPNFSGYLREEHPLFKIFEDKAEIRIMQLGATGDIGSAISAGTTIVNGVGAIAAAAEGEFPEDEEEEGGGKEKKEKQKAVKLQFEIYGRDYVQKLMHITVTKKGTKASAVFTVGNGKDKKKDKSAKKEPKKLNPDGTKIPKVKVPALLEVTQTGVKFTVKSGGKTLCSIRKHPQNKAFKTHYQILGSLVPAPPVPSAAAAALGGMAPVAAPVAAPSGAAAPAAAPESLLFDAVAGSAEMSTTFKICPPSVPGAVISKVKRRFKATSMYKDNNSSIDILFPKGATCDVKAMLLGFAMVIEMQETSSDSVLTKSAGAVGTVTPILGVIGKFAGVAGGGE